MAIETRTSSRDGRPRYLVRIEIRDASGKRRQQRVGTYSNRRQAVLAEAAALDQRERGVLLDPDHTTVAELMAAWLAVKATEVTSNSLRDYEIVVRRHIVPALGSVKIRSVSAAFIQNQYANWVRDGMSPRMVRGCAMRLSAAFDFAVRTRLLQHNPIKDARPPRLERRAVDHWSAADLAKFLQVADDDAWAPLWTLLAREGLRRGEALGLTWANINWDRSTIHIRQTVILDKADRGAPKIVSRAKTQAGERTVHVTGETLEILAAHRKHQVEVRLAAMDWADLDLVNTTRTGSALNPSNVGRSFNALVAKAGVPRIRLHAMRHTVGTLLLQSGVNVKSVSERLGHSSVGITLNLYASATPAMQAEAAQAMSELLAREAQ